ncbi:hypothetical protein ACJRO7_031592, partial [Eucalyptus globulus]
MVLVWQQRGVRRAEVLRQRHRRQRQAAMALGRVQVVSGAASVGLREDEAELQMESST